MKKKRKKEKKKMMSDRMREKKEKEEKAVNENLREDYCLQLNAYKRTGFSHAAYSY